MSHHEKAGAAGKGRGATERGAPGRSSPHAPASLSDWSREILRGLWGLDHEHSRGRRSWPVQRTSAGAWEPYARLLESLPGGTRVSECIAGMVWTLVMTSAGEAGLSLTFSHGLDESRLPGRIAGHDTREVAGLIERWNLFEASVGCAAVNAVLNSRSHLEAATGRPLEELVPPDETLFDRLATRFRGGKVAVVGHFGRLERLAESCHLTILERNLESGDTPDSAAEYVLPEQDCVCITGSAAVNKTLPRLLELAGSAYTVLAGPSVPLSPVWFGLGVDLLAGTVVTDAGSVRAHVIEGAHRRMFRAGLTRVEISAADLL
jgi:uncharacterized protein (DUF4213/DUF364 family)